MSHGITEKDTAWFYNAPAWHKLGKVEKTRPKDARDWCKRSGLLWDVELQEFVTLPTVKRVVKDISGDIKRGLPARVAEYTVEDFRALVRKDTGDVFAVVSPSFELWQNVECFELLEGILGKVIPETAFSLWGGKQVGALTRLPDHIEVGGDQVRTYIYIRIRHGVGAVWILPTNVRVVCANTDRQALAEAGGANSELIFKIHHRGEKSRQIALAREALGLTIAYNKQFKKLGDRLARQQVSERKMLKIIDELWPAGESKRAIQSHDRLRQTILAIADGDTAGNSPGSRWSFYNALTEYDQHVRGVRAPDEQGKAERRFIRAFEDPEGFQKRALTLVMN